MSLQRAVKEKDRFEDNSASYRGKRLRAYAALLRANALFLPSALAAAVRPSGLFAPHALERGFFGANCPPSPSADLEDLMFRALADLGLGAVRVDWGYESDRAMVERWIERLLDGGFDVLPHLVQPSAEASRMDMPEARQRWAEFAESAIARFAGRVRHFEIGSTPNRHSWSGYTTADYATAARIAQEIAERRGAKLIGPNTSDFAPYFTVALMDACARAGARFAAMSDNLFIDRAGAPEAYDPSVAGRALRGAIKMDLPRKSAALLAIARHFGVERVWSTYCYFTLALTGSPRKSRKRPWRYVSPGEYADRLVRYYVLSAAAGALERVYWGNLAGHYKGVIDDGYPHRPDPPTVHHKFFNYGEARNYARRPAFEAFRHLIERLRGARFAAVRSRRDPFAFEFERQGERTLVAWSVNPEGETHSSIDEALASGAAAFSRDGARLGPAEARRLGPSPAYLVS